MLALAVLLCLMPTASARAPARLDPSLAGRGFLFSAVGSASPAPRSTRAALDARGRLVAVTGSGDELVVVRYLPNGRPDPSFGTAGTTRVRPSSRAAQRPDDEAIASAVAIQPDGRILIGGSYDPDLVIEGGSGSSELVLARLRPSGGLDRAFGGRARLEMPEGVVIERRGTSVLAIALQGEGILIGGETPAGAAYVARYSAAGRLDRGFGRGTGMAHFTRGEARGAVSGLLPLPGGGVLAAGHLGADFLLARLGRDGIPDRRFGSAGRVLTDVTRRAGCGCSVAEGLARDGRGRLLVSGTLLARRPRGPYSAEGVAGARAIAVARYLPDGTLDRGFGEGGVARTRIGANARGHGVALERSGRIAVAGSSVRGEGGRARFTVVRYLPDGNPDRRFFGDGVFSRSFGTRTSGAWEPLLDRSGRLIVAGSGVAGESPATSTRGILLARFLPGH